MELTRARYATSPANISRVRHPAAGTACAELRVLQVNDTGTSRLELASGAGSPDASPMQAYGGMVPPSLRGARDCFREALGCAVGTVTAADAVRQCALWEHAVPRPEPSRVPESSDVAV